MCASGIRWRGCRAPPECRGSLPAGNPSTAIARMMFRPDLRCDAANQILRAQQIVQVSRHAGERYRVVRHRYASVNVAQKIIVDVGKTGIVGEAPALEVVRT